MKLTIITVCRNNLEGLKQTYKSIASQTARKEFEWIVVDGASTDGTPRWLADHSHEIDRYISEPDRGIYHAMNKGVGMASGEYLLFLNSGDYLYDSQSIVRALPELDGTDLVYSDIITFDPNTGNYYNDISPELLTPTFFLSKTLPHQSTFIRKQLLIDNPYSENYRIAGDYVFFIKCVIIRGITAKKIRPTLSVFVLDGISSNDWKATVREQNRAFDENINPSLAAALKQLDRYQRYPFQRLGLLAYQLKMKYGMFKRKLLRK